MFEERRRPIRMVLIFSWGCDGEMEACSVSGVPSRKEVAPGQEGEREAGVCIRSKFNSLGRSLHLEKEPGKLGEPIQEKELLFGFWVTNEDEGGS